MAALAGGAGFGEDVGIGVVFEPGATAHAGDHVAVGAAAHAHGQDVAHGRLGVRRLSEAITTLRASSSLSRRAHVGAIPGREGLLVGRTTPLQSPSAL